MRAAAPSRRDIFSRMYGGCMVVLKVSMRLREACARPAPPFNKLFRAFALRRAGLVSDSKNKLQYT